MAGPSSSATPEVKAALRKLVRALPEPFRSSAEAASNALVVDQRGWDDAAPGPAAPPHLDAVQQAVVDGERLELAYVARHQVPSTRVVHPLGVATKGAVWYLVADTDAGLRTFRVDRITGVRRTGEPVARPDGFDLSEAWRLITDEVDQRRTPVRARAAVAPDAVWLVRFVLGTRVRIGPAGDDGRIDVELRGHSVESLAGEIAGLGSLVEVLDPPEVRNRLKAIGRQLTELY